MTIDIIDLSDPAYADLSPVQMAMVRAAQAKKDGILTKASAEQEKLLYRLMQNDNARSSAGDREKTRIAAQAETDVAIVREDLFYQLAYEALGTEGNDQGPYRYPENPNYNLTYSQRFLVVRDYYMHVTDSASVRLEAYRMDTLARSYLGDFYQTLYDLFASQVK